MTICMPPNGLQCHSVPMSQGKMRDLGSYDWFRESTSGCSGGYFVLSLMTPAINVLIAPCVAAALLCRW